MVCQDCTRRGKESGEHDMDSLLFGGCGHGLQVLFNCGQRDSRDAVDAAEDYYDSRVKLDYIVIES